MSWAEQSEFIGYMEGRAWERGWALGFLTGFFAHFGVLVGLRLAGII